MASRDKNSANVPANLKRAVKATTTNLPKAVKAAAKPKP